MKIACLISSLGVGGAERQLVYLADTLQKAGHQLHVISYHEGGFYRDKATGYGLHTVEMDLKGGSLAFAWRLSRYIRQEGIELVIAFMVGASTKACLSHIMYPHFRLFVSERCLNTFCLPHDYLRFFLFNRAEKIICNSYAQGDFVRMHCKWLADRVVVIPNFVDSEEFCPSPDKKAGDTYPRRIVVTARGAKRKNALGLIKACAQVRQRDRLRIDWYGMQPGSSYEAKCKDMIRREGLENIFFLHPAEKNALKLYREADLFCLPSFYEGTSNSMAEALACGLPVMISDRGDNSMYVTPGVNGVLFDPVKTSSIAAALETVLALDSSALAEMSAASRKVAAELLGRDLYTERYNDVLF